MFIALCGWHRSLIARLIGILTLRLLLLSRVGTRGRWIGWLRGRLLSRLIALLLRLRLLRPISLVGLLLIGCRRGLFWWLCSIALLPRRRWRRRVG